MSYQTSIRIAINEHGPNWLDYFSLQIDPIEEFQDEFVPGMIAVANNPQRVKQELRGAHGIPREVKRKRRQAA